MLLTCFGANNLITKQSREIGACRTWPLSGRGLFLPCHSSSKKARPAETEVKSILIIPDHSHVNTATQYQGTAVLLVVAAPLGKPQPPQPRPQPVLPVQVSGEGEEGVSVPGGAVTQAVPDNIVNDKVKRYQWWLRLSTPHSPFFEHSCPPNDVAALSRDPEILVRVGGEYLRRLEVQVDHPGGAVAELHQAVRVVAPRRPKIAGLELLHRQPVYAGLNQGQEVGTAQELKGQQQNV